MKLASSFAALPLVVVIVVSTTLSVEGMETANIATGARQTERILSGSEHSRPPAMAGMPAPERLDHNLRPAPHYIPDRPQSVEKPSLATRFGNKMSRALKALFRVFYSKVETQVYRQGKGFITATRYQLPKEIYEWPEMKEDITVMYKALKDFDENQLFLQIRDQRAEISGPVLSLYYQIPPSELQAEAIRQSLSEMILKIQHNLENLPKDQKTLYEHRERQKQMIQVKILKVLSVDKGNDQATKAMESVLKEMNLRSPSQRPQLMPYLQAAHHIIQAKAAEVQSTRHMELFSGLREPNQNLPEDLKMYEFLRQESNDKLSNIVKLPYAYMYSHLKNPAVDQQAEAATMLLLQRSVHGDLDAHSQLHAILKETWHDRPTTHPVGTRLQEAVQMLDSKSMRTREKEREYRQTLKSLSIQSWSHELQGVQDIQLKNAYRSAFVTGDANRFTPVIEWAGHTVNPQGPSGPEFEFALKTLFIHSTNKPDGITDNLAFQKLLLAQELYGKHPTGGLYKSRMISETIQAVLDSGTPKKLSKADIDSLAPPSFHGIPPAAAAGEHHGETH